ncbi:MAG: metallophosphoesterase family protein [bacterium]|nr:metallophosphoesterase family protein [bacterium]
MQGNTSRERVHTIIFSDTHVGSPLFLEKAFRAAFDRYEVEQIIGNGDIVDGANFEHAALESINDEVRRGATVVWLRGNHDDVSPTTEGVREEYGWKYSGKRFLAMHGDQFDLFVHRNRRISGIGAWIYRKIQRSGPIGRSICARLKQYAKKYTRAFDYIADGAIEYAARNKIDHVFCGHTHHADHRFQNGVQYYNSGCWTSLPYSFITIGERGIRTHYFNREGDELRIESYPI